LWNFIYFTTVLRLHSSPDPTIPRTRQQPGPQGSNHSST